MAMIVRIRKGLNVFIEGAPDQSVSEGAGITSVALTGADYSGVRPALAVAEGARVKLGQPLFTDRKRPQIRFTSPGAGIVTAINWGEKRALNSIVVHLDGDAESEFVAYPTERLPMLTREDVVNGLLASGLWPAFRTRPYSRVPDPGSEPRSVFITAMDSNPLAARAELIINAQADDFGNGLTVVSHLSPGPVFLCKDAGADIPEGDSGRVVPAAFIGPHPAGLPGTHIHFLDPVGPEKSVWHIGYQDVIAIGRLFTTGRLWTDRIISLAGPAARHPRLIRTRLGASVKDLVSGEAREVAHRVVSGSVLSGREAVGAGAYLGRYHTQVTLIPEDRDPGRGFRRRGGRYSVAMPSLSSLFARGPHRLTTSLNGRPGPMIPIGAFERVMPLDILPTPLLRALLVRDIDTAQALGCLELDEEDLALLSFVCPGKCDYGSALKAALADLEKGSPMAVSSMTSQMPGHTHGSG